MISGDVRHLCPVYNLVVVGGGPAGLDAALAAQEAGVEHILLVDRETEAGGILLQCIHGGFGLHRFQEELTGPEYAQRLLDRVAGTTIDDRLQPQLDRAWDVACDTVLLSIGLLPDNELAHRLRLQMDPVTGGPIVASTMETSQPGMFACGNGVHIHDLVDFVSQEAALAGRCAARALAGDPPPADNVRLAPGENVSYCVPHSIATDREHIIYLRVRRPLEACSIRLSTPGGEFIHEKKLRYVVPAEMVNLTLRPRFLENFHGDALRIDVTPR